MGLPVNLWVVLLEPGESKDDVLPTKIGDCECGPFGVTIEMEDCIYNLSDGPALIWRTVHIVDWNRLTDLMSGQSVVLNVVLAHEGSCGPTVY